MRPGRSVQTSRIGFEEERKASAPEKLGKQNYGENKTWADKNLQGDKVIWAVVFALSLIIILVCTAPLEHWPTNARKA